MLSKKQCVNLLLSGISARWDDKAQWKDPSQTVQSQNKSAEEEINSNQEIVLHKDNK